MDIHFYGYFIIYSNYLLLSVFLIKKVTDFSVTFLFDY